MDYQCDPIVTESQSPNRLRKSHQRQLQIHLQWIVFYFMLPTILVLCAVVAVAAFLGWKFHQASAQKDVELQQIRARYAQVIDVNAELAKQREELGRLRQQRESEDATNAEVRIKLAEEYRVARNRLAELQREVHLLEENLEDISFGVYRPHFSFQTAEDYKIALTTAREHARQIVRDGRAATCPVSWTVSDSRKDGERMVKQYTKLQLRAFNGECEAAMANITWNNATKMEERVRKAFDMINQLGVVMQVSITQEYLQAKLKELQLTYEYDKQKYDEREEQRRQREERREEEKALQEAEKAQLEAETEEERYQKLLVKAREEAAKSTGAQLEKLTTQIASLQAKIEEAHSRKERAIARAQLTKSGFVYVISNIGAFGEKVFKIGMTRRMEPMDRIYELGDASVPFAFDVHVMMFSDNAPELEGALHDLFESRRVNMVNRRKEFYRNVELTEIEVFVKKRGLSAQFIQVPEAKEYRETLALLEERKHKSAAAAVNEEAAIVAERFPERLFT